MTWKPNVFIYGGTMFVGFPLGLQARFRSAQRICTGMGVAGLSRSFPVADAAAVADAWAAAASQTSGPAADLLGSVAAAIRAKVEACR